jgi:hypothetical protein
MPVGIFANIFLISQRGEKFSNKMDEKIDEKQTRGGFTELKTVSHFRNALR